MCEILFPVDDRNWDIKPTPIPEVANMTGDQRPTVDPATGQPTGMTANDEAKIVMEAAKKAAEAMRNSIDDSLTECDYNGESRKLVENAIRLGTGIFYGPFPARQTSKIWLPQPDGTQTLKYNENIVPATQSLDPWDVWFDPACGNDHQRGRGFWMRRNVTRKELRSVVGLPGYDTEAIREVLRTNPCRIRVAEGRVMRDVIQEDSYEMWTYHGEIEPDEMLTLTERAGDPITDVSFGVLVMVNDKVVGAMPSWVADETLPIDVWCWRKSDDSPYGYGLPDELEHQQRVVNAAWRQVMDNGRTSLGGQIVMKKGVIIPQNGSYEITPNKIWLAKDDLEDVRQAFSVFEFNSHLQELLSIAQAAMAFADTETSMPQIMGGEQGSAPETVGGMVMLYNNANAVLRQRVKLYDDGITRPHIGRYYDWKMANDPEPAIKGDYEVDARGSTALVERDIQNQALLNLANITNNPRYAPLLKEREELKAILKAFKVNPDELMKNEDEVAQEQQAMAEQGAPQDPREIAAQTQLQIKQMDIQDKQAQREFEALRNEREFSFRGQNLQYNAMREQSEAEQAAVDAQLQRELAIAKMEADGAMTREEMDRKERLELIKITDGRERFNAEAALRVRTGAGI
jgi:ribosomal protein S13